MKTKHLFLLSALAFFACADLQAQVRIGDTTVPTAGAILDLNSIAKGGLLLSNVTLTNWCTIPNEIYESDAINADGDKKSDFTGAMVYHTGTPDIPAGVYIWKGWRWISVGGDPILYDTEGNDYTIGCFCNAGVWMTQNLRSTDVTYKSDDKTSVPLNPYSGLGSTTEPQFTYPRINGTWGSIAEEYRDSVFRAHPEYGLMYNWVAASGRINDNTDDSANGGQPGFGTTPPTEEVYHRGICPDGWHLPSDYEWSELEIEIATNPKNYSEQQNPYAPFTEGNYGNLYTTMNIWRPDGSVNNTYWGRQMKSNNDSKNIVNGESPNGTSKSREEGGFDALQVGDIKGSIGFMDYYGTGAFFWSGSSGSSSGGVTRHLHRDVPSMCRYNDLKEYLFSVRCKKD
jgi:uncharacterized protein (TIGR02145 family)